MIFAVSVAFETSLEAIVYLLRSVAQVNMFIFGMHPCIYEETSQRQLSGHLKAFLFLGIFGNLSINMAPPNFLI